MRLQRPAPGRITQGFTIGHRGIDFGWGLGKAVKASASGYVRLETDSGYGLRIFLEHGDGHETEYSHLAGRTVRNRQWVAAGTRIATMGNSGTFARFVHLHFAHWVDGVRIQPVFGGTATLPAGETVTPLPTIDPTLERRKRLTWLS